MLKLNDDPLDYDSTEQEIKAHFEENIFEYWPKDEIHPNLERIEEMTGKSLLNLESIVGLENY